MAIGFNTTSAYGNRDVTPDKGLTSENKQKVLLAKFGDGYEQRLAHGINSLTQTYKVVFAKRPKEEIDDIVSFLNSTNGASNFDFTIPNSNEVSGELTIKVVCDSYAVTYLYDNFYSADAVFRRVYEA